MSENNDSRKRATVIELISRVGQTLQSSRGLESILKDIIEIIIELMAADACSIYLYEDGLLRLKSTKGMGFTEDEKITIGLGEGITGLTALDKKPYAIRDIDAREDLGNIPIRGSKKFRALLSVPMLDGDKLIGVMNVWKKEPYEHTETEKNFIMFIATQLVGSIRITQLYEEVIRGFREIATIHQVGQIVSSVLELDELLPVIARTICEHLSARGCVVRLLNPDNGLLEIRGYYGITPEQAAGRGLEPGEGIPGQVVSSSAPVIRKEPCEFDDEQPRDLENMQCSIICVPLTYKNKVIGTLGVFDKILPFSNEPALFENEDIGLVSMIGNQVAMAIDNAHLYNAAKQYAQEKDLRIKELSLLLEITNVMRSSTDLDELLYMILTSVTMGEGLGFNRALLFLTDDNDRVLDGKMAVGPLRPEDAERHWNAIVDKSNKTLYEKVKEYGRLNMEMGFEIDRRIKSASIPLSAEKGVIARTALERSTFNVTDYCPPEHSEEQIIAQLGFSTFVSVPLIAKDRVIGVVVVDNLITKEPITDDLVKFLKLFANQAASAIEMGWVYKNLERTNRHLIDARDLLVRTKTLATLGEFSAGVAHELRNPLVAIGGFSKRLAKMLDGESKEARYAAIISREVEGLEKILNQILDFVGGAKPSFKRADMVNLIEQVLRLFNASFRENNIEVLTDYDSRVNELVVDEVQMRQLFINLVKNAIEAMKGEGGTLSIASALVEEGAGGVGFEISDTGSGIHAEDLEHIFDPFFTKKEEGTGLGLPMCSRIVEGSHGGRIFVDSKIGRGTNILVWLPVDTIPAEGRLNFEDAQKMQEHNRLPTNL